MNEYKKPRLTVRKWRVNAQDLKTLYYFFANRFKRFEIEIHLETSTGNNAVYTSFDRFHGAVSKLVKKKHGITSILFSAGHIWPGGISKQKHLWADIHFDHGDAEFYLFARDNDGTLNEWVEQTYKGLKNLHSAFENHHKATDTVILDYLDLEENSYKGLMRTPITEIAFKEGDGWFKNPIQLFSLFISVAGVTVSLTSLIIQLILK